MKTDKYAFFLDIDSTLWKWGVIPPINKETIKRVRELGHKVFINTGRSYGYIPKTLFDEVELDGVVSGIGASVRINGEHIEKKHISAEDIKYIFEYFAGKGIWVIFEGEERVIFYNDNKEAECNFLPEGTDAYILLDENEWNQKYLCEPISKITVDKFVPNEEEIAELSKRFSVISHPEENYTEIGVLGYDKGVGMLKAAEFLGIDVSHCVAMGDSPNDLAMLEAAGISVAMGDAYDVVKGMADIVSVNCMDGGVAHAMKLILKI